MKTTFDLPEELVHRAKIAAVERKTTLTDLVVCGLDSILRPETSSAGREDALAHLRKGLHLGGKPLTREQVHERR